MTIPDWTEAPEGATHYDVIADLFCTVDYFWSKGKRIGCNGGHFNWNTDRYTPRPLARATTAWDSAGFPPVGTKCEVNWCDEWMPATIEHLLVWKGETECIYKTSRDWDFSSCLDDFRPLGDKPTDRTQLVTALNQLRNETDMGVLADVILSIGFRLER